MAVVARHTCLNSGRPPDLFWEKNVFPAGMEQVAQCSGNYTQLLEQMAPVVIVVHAS